MQKCNLNVATQFETLLIFSQRAYSYKHSYTIEWNWPIQTVAVERNYQQSFKMFINGCMLLIFDGLTCFRHDLGSYSQLFVPAREVESPPPPPLSF